MQQRQRREILIRALLDEDPKYGGIEIPQDETAQRQLLRSLFNVRMPGEISDEFLMIQDEYLREEISGIGVTSVTDLIPAETGIYLWQGDITTLKCGAVVNAANSGMTGCYQPCHNCIDNCIHTYAGIQLRNECHRRMQQLRGMFGPDYMHPTAVPMITDAYNLPSEKVIHVVGPIVTGPLRPEHEELLSRCYSSCLDLAMENGLGSIAFCCISTGVFMFPNERAAQIAVDTVRTWLKEHTSDMKVIFDVFGDRDLMIYMKLLKGSQ